MRLVALALSLVLAASAPLAAQAPVTTRSLASGEMLLETSALGITTARADRARLSFNIVTSGPTEAAARSQADFTVSNVRRGLRGLGVADADIRIELVSVQEALSSSVDLNATDVVVNAVDADEMNGMALVEPAFSATARVEVLIRDVDRVGAVQTAAVERGVVPLLSPPVYALADDRVPRREARARALQRARADAESRAASLNMRIARMVRITERTGVELLPQLFGAEPLMLREAFSGAHHDPDIMVFVVLGVDFVLAPR